MRINVLSPYTGANPRHLRLHSYHDTRTTSINEAEPWSLVHAVIIANKTNSSLTSSLSNSFPIRPNHPLHAMPRKHHRIFWSTIARFVICLHFPEHNRRSGYTTYKPFFSPEGGIQIAATNDNHPYSHLENLWGETSKISLATHRLLKECDTASCRTICSPPGGTHAR